MMALKLPRLEFAVFQPAEPIDLAPMFRAASIVTAALEHDLNAVDLRTLTLTVEVRRELSKMFRRLADQLEDPQPFGADQMEQTFERLGNLQDNWDGEGAPAPSPAAIEQARQIVSWLVLNHVPVAEIDADVLGGIAIWVLPAAGRTAWVACMNDGARTLVSSDNGAVSSATWNPAAQASLLSFADGDAHH